MASKADTTSKTESRGDSNTEDVEGNAEDMRENVLHSNALCHAKRKEEDRKLSPRKHVSQAEADHDVQETEKYRDKHEENKAKIEGAPPLNDAKHLHRVQLKDKLKDKFDHDRCENREVLWNLVAARA